MNRREALKHTSLIMGYAFSGSTLAGILNSCKSGGEHGWQPMFFTAGHAETMAEITEQILPETDTPGAKSLMLDRFIDRMMKECFSPEEQQHFLKGLQAFEEECQEKYDKAFVKCSAAQQEEFIKVNEGKAAGLTPSIWGFPVEEPAPVPFYRTVKDLTLLGYFTSEEVGKHILSYDPVPGAYLSCISASEVGNAWTE